MAKRDDRSRKLKAAARRRARRPAPASDPPRPKSAAGTAHDVVGRLVAEILEAAERQRRASDTVAIEALRACTRLTPPSHPETRALYDRLQQVAASADVEPRQFRRAVEQLLEIARQQSGQNHQRDNFLSYLAVLAD